MDYLTTLSTKMGGPVVVLEIDESLFYKPKKDRGGNSGVGRIFEGVERVNHSNSCMILVPARLARVLITIILEHIEQGSNGYIYLINKQLINSMDLDTYDIHTQNIENF
ncbi:hypothetical protein HZS_4517 [Henneguya salminicola]|nr:hypothetical protein HZS_4517 [Henneguya salminicola]